jgi:peptide/nickel transport system substrate-binding protein
MLHGRYRCWLASLAGPLLVLTLLPAGQAPPEKSPRAGPVLYVGVRSLPERLSPATAWTDPERQAVELIFERLVREVYDDELGERYVPGLAEELPQVIPGGRRCRLARDAYWSNGKRVTAKDVRDTILRLLNPKLPWRTSEWTELMGPLVVSDKTPFRIVFHYRHGFLDPLLPLSFHVLPQGPLRADDPAFAKAPIGSGPFLYAGRQAQEGRQYAIFPANPHYRPGAGQPCIREVRFFAWGDLLRDVQDPARPWHLLLDVPTDTLAALQERGVGDVRTLQERRVYFLAINHRVEPLKNPALRRALAHGLDREGILTACFRGGHPSNRVIAVLGAAAAAAAKPLCVSHRGFHRAANGPYPPQSWACAPPERVPASLYNVEKARSFLGAAQKDGIVKVELTLKYPNDDPHVEMACREIARQLAALGESVQCPVTLKLIGLPPHQLREALERRDYQLAYHHVDYGSEAYWLWPLFDNSPQALAEGGSNYLGYANDGVLVSLFRRAMAHRDFSRVRELSHDIHARLFETMPLIPLWQLDTHLAVHPDLTPSQLDPLLVFGGVAHWKLKER